MNYFDEGKHAEDYIHMSRKYDGRDLIPPLQTHLTEGSSLLELGMGPGKDLDLLSQYYTVTGSDSAQTFLDIYRENHPHADVLLLDAVTLDTKRRFDCIYSNKVLMHLTRNELERSFRRQADILNPGGIAFHTFWHGDKEEIFDGLRFIFYQPENLNPLIGPKFSVIDAQIYKESAKDDSFFIILKKID